ncbi:MAG TPA: hypothetical protein VLA89_16750 [Gemmatimonadales bacterium]|nr:hypothetical protein [Gemmatimonadales bacterium]
MTLGVVTVAILNVVIIVGAGLPDSASGERLIAALIPVLDFCVVVSSVLLGKTLVARGLRTLGILFFLNIALFALAIVVRVSGSMPPRWLLFATDVYWLNLYLITLAKHWRLLAGHPAA